jgi:formamidopyrimidine-DNA glycosylase
MPEVINLTPTTHCTTTNASHQIGEVARVVHFLRKHCANRVISTIQVQEDNIVYGKVGTSATAFQKAFTGKKILDAKQQGKYFWLEMEGKLHPVMHLGMTGWIKFKNDDTTHYYGSKNDKNEPQEWPPRFWKFILQLDNDSKQEIAFVDARRLARIRVVEAEAKELRNTTPLKENGPDPVIDKDILTEAWLGEKLKSKKVPVKALMLDQANISGIGNWVADEILYQARIHPEQYSYTFSAAQITALHKAMMDVCGTAVAVLSDSSKFPETWLMRYRWDKGKKDKNILPNGDKIVHLKVGGRTSAIVPRLQKKTGKVAGDVESADEVSEDAANSQEEPTPKKPKATKAQPKTTKGKAKKTETPIKDEIAKEDSKPKRTRTTKRKAGSEDEDAEMDVKAEEDEEVKPAKKRQTKKSQATTDKATKSKPEDNPAEDGSRRRSGRLSGKGV